MLRHATEYYYQNKISRLEKRVEILKQRLQDLTGETVEEDE